MKKNPMVRFKDMAQHNKIKKATKILFATIAIALTFGFYGADFSGLNKSDVATGLTVAALPLFMIKGQFKELEGEELATFKAEATPEQLGEYYEALNKHNRSKLEDLIKANASKEDVNKLLEALKATPNEGLEDVKKEVIRLAGELKALNEKGISTVSSYKDQIVKFITENKETIKNLRKAGTGTVEVELKAVANVTTGSATNQGTVPTQYGEFTDPQIVGNWIESYVTASSTNSPNYPYTEVIPKDGNYAFLAEAETKPQIDFKMETRFATPVKAAAWEKLTEEAMDDIPCMNDLANQILLKKHNIFKQRGIISGDGVSPNPKGIVTYGRAFVAGSMAGKVVNPNFMDVVNACIADMRTTHNYTDETPFVASVVMVNDIDFFLEIQSAKDSTGRPLFDYNPITQVARMGSVAIVPTPEITAGKIMVVDASKYNVVNYKPYTVRIGWVNDDFIKNQFVILGESRFYAFVKKLDEQAFIYDTIDTIKDAIKLS